MVRVWIHQRSRRRNRKFVEEFPRSPLHNREKERERNEVTNQRSEGIIWRGEAYLL
jgi:hypothetical protein